ncbi:nicotinamide riboside transporter PnuC [Ruminococcus flavefaciens]|uniref:nicotinamide riboside transporter PnuC n=1 Tax=Ruminococcus flavefaciens TaxID=1265 RepID=UPI000686AF07|nr:nicotinamide riboside transporter PnuC [Ruminococcus flavefaciens]
MKLKQLFSSLTIIDYSIWSAAMLFITVSFLIFDRTNLLTLAASVIGVTSIIINAKGHPLGQLLMLFFAAVYGYFSFSFRYYGEMITYLGMTAPMALFALISWLRNPFKEGNAEVRVNHLSRLEIAFMSLLTMIVTVIFYFILRHFNTANLIPSIVSVTTSFAAVYLTFRRSAFFSLLYAANDVVLIVLWALASITDSSYISVLICFVMFLVSDIYGFVSWLKMKKRQEASDPFHSTFSS